jgi:hypothetical protein
MAGPQRLDGGLADVVRRVEVGLADLEVDDLAALGLEGPGPGQHLERRFGAEAGHAVCESHRNLSLRDRDATTGAAPGASRLPLYGRSR